MTSSGVEFGISAAVVADSLTPKGDRLITLEIELPRFILSQFNTHRKISKNFQSSRAIPVKRIIEQVKDSPVIPIHWGKNQSGMQAEQELGEQDRILALATWKEAKDQAVLMAEKMSEIGVHKQIVNRILEPFMWQKGITTATHEGWNSFLSLRLHEDAQPEIYELASKIKEAIDGSHPKLLSYGCWHIPYITHQEVIDRDNKVRQIFFSGGKEVSLEEAVKISVSCCGQVSYRKLDDSLDKAMKVYDMLNLPSNGEWPEEPPHFSPTEHIALCYDGYSDKNWYNVSDNSGNFHSWELYQLRKMYEQGVENKFLVNSEV